MLTVSLLLLAAYAGVIAWSLLANRPVTNRNTDKIIHYICTLMEHHYITTPTSLSPIIRFTSYACINCVILQDTVIGECTHNLILILHAMRQLYENNPTLQVKILLHFLKTADIANVMIIH